MSDLLDRIDGVVIGVFLGLGEDGPLVVFPGNPDETALPARSLAELSSDMIGSQVALLFEDGNPHRPLIVGRVVLPKIAPETKTVVDEKTVIITSDDKIEIRCGKASIIMEKDGHITIRGSYVTSHASAANRIRGGSINLN
jgi:hypothetical protein